MVPTVAGVSEIRADPAELTRMPSKGSPIERLEVLLNASRMYDNSSMEEVTWRKLRNQTRGFLDRVAGGESICITTHGRPVARRRGGS
ncbi:type II toxin-antitoxin system Phd/YefM family antitoxin [Candidatus Poriferisodalis sp.]|uniref:type II toxin-antitoxin system Phd/YefM family antitoxin n=1 Tax=Candidatus Poriferisodalis sp. TaxID=3101277 RepID=UPI003D119350